MKLPGPYECIAQMIIQIKCMGWAQSDKNAVLTALDELSEAERGVINKRVKELDRT